jgi:hypothetical protein
MGLIPSPDTKDYWSSEGKTQIRFFGDVMSTDPFFTDILDDACVEMIPLNKASGPSKGQESTWDNRTYIEIVSERFRAR